VLQTCTVGGDLFAWSDGVTPQGELLCSIPDASESPKKCLWLPRSRSVLTIIGTNIAFLSYLNGRLIRRIETEQSIQDAALNPLTESFALALSDGTISIWNSDGDEQTAVLQHGDLTQFVEFSRDGKFLLSQGDGQIRLWDSEGGSRLVPGSENIGYACLTPDSQSIVYSVLSPSNTIFQAPLDSLLGTRITDDYLDYRYAVTFSEASDRFVWQRKQAGGKKSPYAAQFMKLSGDEVGHTKGRFTPTTFAWSNDDSVVYAGCQDGTIQRIDVATGNVDWTGIALRKGETAVFTPEGKFLSGKPGVIDREFVFVLRGPDGVCELYSPSEFYEQFSDVLPPDITEAQEEPLEDDPSEQSLADPSASTEIPADSLDTEDEESNSEDLTP